MADIRKSGVLDDFQRADVNPIDGNWAKVDPGYSTLRIDSGRAEGNAGDSMYYWTDSGPFAGDCEVWGIPGPGSDLTEAWRLGLLKDVGGAGTQDGYQQLLITGVGGIDWALRKYTNGGWETVVSVSPGISGAYQLLRRLDGFIEGWGSADGETWTMAYSYEDTQYASASFYLCMGISSDDGGNPSWEGIGGGGIFSGWLPQQIRRTREVWRV